MCDRGTDTFQAATVATYAVKNHNCDLDAAQKSVDACISAHGFVVEREDVRVWLKRHHYRDAALRIGLDRDGSPVDERYRQYQTLLHRETGRQEQMGVYHHIIIE